MILRYLPTVLLIIKNTVNHLLMAHDDVVIAGIGFFTYNIINLLLMPLYLKYAVKNALIFSNGMISI